MNNIILLPIKIVEPPEPDGKVISHNINLVMNKNGHTQVEYNDKLITELIKEDVDKGNTDNTDILIFILQNFNENYPVFENDGQLSNFFYMYLYIHSNIHPDYIQAFDVLPPKEYKKKYLSFIENALDNEEQDNFDLRELAGADEKLGNEQDNFEFNPHTLPDISELVQGDDDVNLRELEGADEILGNEQDNFEFNPHTLPDISELAPDDVNLQEVMKKDGGYKKTKRKKKTKKTKKNKKVKKTRAKKMSKRSRKGKKKSKKR